MKKDINERAFEIAGMLTGSIPKNKVLDAYKSKIGALGGNARAKKLTAKQRRNIAIKAANTRWGKD